MGKISSYIKASSPISGTDKLIGTDSANNNETKNFTVQEIADFVGLGPYKVYTALLSQGGINITEEVVAGNPLSLGVTYYIFINEENVDLTVFGAPDSNEGTYFVCTQAGNLPIGVNITLQYNPAAPVVTVLENTIGDIYWTYSSTGLYLANLADAFTDGKTYQVIGDTYDILSINRTEWNSSNAISVQTLLYSTLSVDDGLLYKTPIEIRVYN